MNWDVIGIGTSLACAIHCTALPLALSGLQIAGIESSANLYFELAMATAAILIGACALGHSYRKHHKQNLPLILFSAGSLFLILKLLFPEYELWLLLPAVTTIVAAHLVNYRASRLSASKKTTAAIF